MVSWSLLVDIIVVLSLLLGGWRGRKDGLLIASTSLIGLALSLFVAFWLYAWVALGVLAIWQIPASLANIIAFLLLVILIDSIVSMALFWAGKQLHFKFEQQVLWHTAGIIPGLLNSLIMIGYIASLILALPLDHPIKVAVRDSLLAPRVSAAISSVGAPVDQLVQPALNDLSQLLTVEPESKELVNLPFKVQNPNICSDLEEDMLVLLNKERSQRSIGVLTMDEPLRNVGRSHSLDMFQRGYFSHYSPEGKDPFDRINEANISYQAAGENLALAPTLSAAHTGLMNSPGHKRNILDPNFHKVGIGCYKSDRYGLMFSQEFSD